MELAQKIALIVTIVGAVNWGLVGILDVDLVALIFGVNSVLSKLVYILVGISGLFNIGILMAHLDYKRD